MSIDERVDRLERSNRQLSAAVVILASIVVLGVCGGAYVVDRHNTNLSEWCAPNKTKPYASLEQTSTGAILQLNHGENRQVRIGTSDGGPGIYLYDTEGKLRAELSHLGLTFYDIDEEERTSFGVRGK